MAVPKLKIRLLRITCFTTGESGDDEVFLMNDGNRIWPQNSRYRSMKSGKEEIGVEILDLDQGTMVEIEIWDYDLLSSNDKIGLFKLFADKQGGPFIAEMIKNTDESSVARYNLEWEIF